MPGALVDELRAVLAKEGGGVELHAQSLEDRQVNRQQRFPDVKARENLLLEQQDVVPRHGQKVGGGASRRASADHHHVPERARRRHTRRNRSEVLIPPKAKLLFMVISMLGSRRGSPRT